MLKNTNNNTHHQNIFQHNPNLPDENTMTTTNDDKAGQFGNIHLIPDCHFHFNAEFMNTKTYRCVSYMNTRNRHSYEICHKVICFVIFYNQPNEIIKTYPKITKILNQ